MLCGATGIFGLFDGDASTVFYEVTQVVSNHVVAVIPAAVVGTACGLAAVAFTIVNLKCARLRSRVIGVRLPVHTRPHVPVLSRHSSRVYDGEEF